MIRPGTALLLIGLCIPAMVEGQAPTRYHFRAGDTLVYHAQNRDSSVLTTPQGPVTAVTLSESTVRLIFGARGAATAAFTALTVLLRTDKGPISPTTDSALNRPFLVTVSDRGLAQTISAPPLPEAVTRIVDLATEFDDFFLVLPAKPLAVGVAWVDTVSQTGSAAGGLKFTRRAITNFNVSRDTIVNGIPCLIVVGASMQTLDAAGPGSAPGRTVTNHQTGFDNGFFLFDPVAGRMLGRQRTGEFTGTLRMSGGPRTEEYPLARRFLTGMVLVPRAGP